jgi:hypothetical protein
MGFFNFRILVNCRKGKQMLKKDGTKNVTRASAEEAFKCAECLHFKQSPHRTNKEVCSKLGVRQFALAPKCFTPDYTRIVQNSDELVMLSILFGSKTPQQRKIMLGMLRAKPTGKKFRMGTKLYLKSSTREYISNYLCGYVVGYTSGNEIVIAGSPDLKSRGKMFFTYLRSESGLITQKEWEIKFKELRAKGRISDPLLSKRRDITAKVEQDEYEVPTIDKAPKQANETKINKRRTPLTEIMEF